MRLSALLAGCALLPAAAWAQDMDHSHHGMDMPGMDMPGMDMPAPGAHGSIDGHQGGATAPWPVAGSGTSRLPVSEPAMSGLHLMAGNWMLMLHGTVSAQYTAASGPRGDDKLYATSMVMGSASRETGWGKVELRSMLSLEPAMRRDGYPNLFATGETAYGQPLVDRQHPHDLVMELAGRVDVNIGAQSRAFVYGGPVGEPALGPSAFMHRASATTNPEPPITHHWFDSTHITYGVITAGIATPLVQLEASAFRGREPDERRWNIEGGKLDSWSVRGTLNPGPHWALQASYGEIRQPEATHPGEDERRFTASAHYAGERGLTAMIAYSAKRRTPGETLSAWLAEANWTIDTANTVFGRGEIVTNDELVPDHAAPLHDHAYRVAKVQVGYARRIPLGPVELALGASLATYVTPAALDAEYGRTPVQGTAFARLRLGQ